MLCPSMNYVLGAWLSMHPYESRGIVSSTLVLPISMCSSFCGSQNDTTHTFLTLGVCTASRGTHAPHASSSLKALVTQGIGARENVSWWQCSCHRANSSPESGCSYICLIYVHVIRKVESSFSFILSSRGIPCLCNAKIAGLAGCRPYPSYLQ